MQACHRASTITHVDREGKKNFNYNNEIFHRYFLLGQLTKLHSDIV